MRVSLFGLSPRGINLMNLPTEPTQLIFSHLCISSFDTLFMFGCICSRHGFQRMLSIQLYQYTYVCPCTLLDIYHTTRWRVSDSPGSALDLRVQILKLGSWWTSSWLEWLSGSIVAQRKTSSGPYPSRSPARFSSFSFVTLERILYYSSLYILCILHLRLLVM